jgi:glycosyltransferase involved in cell wall biosynthesis
VADTALPRVAIIAPTDIGAHVLGPALRYKAFADALGARQPVTLLTPNTPAAPSPLYRSIALHQVSEVDAVIASHPVVIVQGYTLINQPHLRAAVLREKPALAVDLYTPLNLEGLNVHDPADARERWFARLDLHALRDQLQLGDFFFCAGERQRDYYLGMLAALGRIGLELGASDPAARQLIDIVPFGCEDGTPEPGPALLKGAHPAIPADAQVLLWLGGIWNWMDAESVVRAFAQIAPQFPSARLVFVTAPIQAKDADGYLARADRAARATSAALGLSDGADASAARVIFFGPVPPAQRGALLLEADLGLSFNRDNLETRFAYRTRLIDYVWAGLPMLIGSGDELGERIAARGLASAVAAGDVAELADAMANLLADEGLRTRLAPGFATLREELRWSRAMQPLLRFCAAPWRRTAALDLDKLPEQTQAEQEQREVDLTILRQENKTLRGHIEQLLAHNAALNGGRVMRTLNRVQGALDTLRGRGTKP